MAAGVAYGPDRVERGAIGADHFRWMTARQIVTTMSTQRFLLQALVRFRLIADAILEFAIPLGQHRGHHVQTVR